jgi:hypothetical protein
MNSMRIFGNSIPTLLAIWMVFTLFLVGSATAQGRNVCTEVKVQRGTMILVAKNSSWFVNQSNPAPGSLSLWFRYSLNSRDMPGLVESGIQDYPSISEAEKMSTGTGNDVKVLMQFEQGDALEFTTSLIRKTSRGEVYYFMPWMNALSPTQHAELFEAAQQAGSVEVSIVDASNGNVLRSSIQLLDGFADVVAEAVQEHQRLLRAQPLGSCSLF